VDGGIKKKGRELAVLCWAGWGFGRDPSYAEYCGIVLCRGVIESRRAWSHAIGISLTDAENRVDEGLFLGLLDEEDEDAATAMAAKMASDAMLARAKANRGV